MLDTRPPRTIDITRAERGMARRRRRRITASVALVALVVAGGWALLPRPTLEPAPPPLRPSTLTVLLVRGGSKPLVAVVGSMGDPGPAALAIPAGIAITMPAGGEGTMADATALPAPSMRTAVSNLVGAWAEHYAVVELRALSRAAESSGLEETRTILSGPDATERWPGILESILAGPEHLSASALAESDDAAAVAEALAGVSGAEVEELPAVLGQGGALRPDPEAADRLVVRLFGLAAAPTSVVVMNASGSPAAAELVAERLLPAGFRLVVSSDAEAFPTTAIVASTHGDRATAEQVRELLGVGEVVVSRVPSGLGEVTVMIGEDLGNG